VWKQLGNLQTLFLIASAYSYKHIGFSSAPHSNCSFSANGWLGSEAPLLFLRWKSFCNSFGQTWSIYHRWSFELRSAHWKAFLSFGLHFPSVWLELY
jgi:hypothetical protein